MTDYCGYCGKDYKGDHKEICDECYADPDIYRTHQWDNEWDEAEQAHDEDHEVELRFYG